MVVNIDAWLFRWADQCEPIKEKCIICENTECQWWQMFNEEETDE